MSARDYQILKVMLIIVVELLKNKKFAFSGKGGGGGVGASGFFPPRLFD